MNKKLISLLVAICLVIGLLPSVTIPHAHATDTAKTAKIGILGSDFNLTEGMEPVYRLRTEYDLYDAEGNLLGKGGFRGNACAATDDWAIKWEWPTGGVPTITLRNAYLGGTVNGVQGYKKDAEGNLTAASIPYALAVATACDTGLKVILEGENFFEGANSTGAFIKSQSATGKHFTDVTIEGENSGKLNAYLVGATSNNRLITVSADNSAPTSITFKNVTIDCKAKTDSAADAVGVICGTNVAVNIINSDITIDHLASLRQASAIVVLGDSSSLTVTDSTLNLNGGSATARDAIVVNGDITFNNSNVTVTALGSSASAVKATGTVTVNGGTLTANGRWVGGSYGIEAGAIKLEAGEMWVWGYQGAMSVAPTLADGTTGTCGSTDYTGWGTYGTRTDDYKRAYVHLIAPAVACAHDWEPATCTEPKTCKLCGEKDGEALGHKWTNNQDTECDNGCGTTRGVAKIGILGSDFDLTEGMDPVYRLRTEYDLYDSTGETLLGKGGFRGNACAATDDWAVKWEWPTGGVPTITLRNAYLRGTVNGVQGYKKDAAGNLTAASIPYALAVPTNAKTGIKLILDGENFFDGANSSGAFIRGNHGAVATQRFTDITIEGVNNGKLNAYLIGTSANNTLVTVSHNDTVSTSVTIKNVTMDVSAATYDSGVICGTSLPVVIENSDITIKNRNGAPSPAIKAAGTGSSLTVKNSTLSVNGGYGSASAAILVNGNITFENSNVTAQALAGSSTAVHANGGKVMVNGGTLTASGLYAGNSYGIEATAIELQAGEMWVWGYQGAMNVEPTLAAGTIGTCGNTDTYADYGNYFNVNGAYGKRYVHLEVPTECTHEWDDATCTEPKTCKLCGEKDGLALGHSGGEATCVQLATCGVCGVTYGELADCKPNAEGTACSVCGRPFAAGDPLPYSMTVKVPLQTTHLALTISKYEEAVYTRNYEYDSTDSAGNAFKATVQTAAGADENNWNVKFVWHAGDRAPTLYIKDMIVDEYNEDTSLWESSLSTPIEFVNNTAVDGEKAKLVITGEKSVFKATWGVRYAIPLEIESEGNAKLEAYTKNTCITCWGGTKAPLTINANLDLNYRGQYGEAHGVIQTFCNDLVINGGDITAHLDSTANAGTAIEVRCAGGTCTDCGDVIINGGNITLSKVMNGSGIIQSAKGDVLINRGSVTVTKAIGHALYAPNGAVKINGGVVDLRTGDYGVCCINAKTSIDINGGTGRIRGNNGAFNKEPALATGINMFAGASPSTATADGPYTSKFVWFGVGDMPVCNHETWLPADCSTPETCADCGETRGKAKPHEGGTATCEDKPVCVNCGKEYGSPLGHTGGEATCQKKAVCETCNNEYGELGVCVLNAEGTACKYCGKVFAAGDTLPYSLTVKVPLQTTHKELKITKFEEAVYTRNYEYDSTDTAGNAFKATVQTTDGADENNWNVKFVWHLGDNAPTLYIKDMIVDEYNEEKALWESSLSTPIEFVNNTAVNGEKAKLVITGDKSVLKANWGVRYAIPLEIESEGNAKLEAYTQRTCITSWGLGATGVPLTINANLDLNYRGQYGNAHGVIQTFCGDLVINGGNITAHLDSTIGVQMPINVYCENANCTDCGDVIINGGNITLSKVSPGSSMINSAKGNVTINGGTVTVTQAMGHVIVAKKAVTINGGVLDLKTGSYGTAYGIDAASIAINGGTGQIRAYKGAFTKAPVLGTGINMYAGATRATAKVDGSHTSKYVWYGAGEMPVCNHETWLPANCTTPKTCAACGETEGNALGHKGGTATCQDKPVCEVCNQPYGSTLAHTGGTQSCKEKPVCDNCDQEYGALLVCDLDDKGLCKVCGTQYTANGPLPHNMSMSVSVPGVTTSIELKITKFEEAVYTRNYEYDSVDTAGNAFKATVQTAAGADENNWNAKFIWHLGDKAPTLYIKGMIVDEYNEDTSLWESALSTPISIENNTDVAGEEAKLVITGDKSVFKALWGVRYFVPLEIKSEGDAMLEAYTKNTCITSWNEKAPLTIDANLDLNYTGQYGDAHGVIQTFCSDLIINGGNISGNLKATGNVQRTINVFCKDKDKCTDCGDIIINGGNIKVTGNAGTAASNGTIRPDKGKIIINGGNLDIASKRAVALYSSKGIEINGGVVNLSSPWYVINAGSKTAPANITFNGGTTTIIGQYCIYKDGGAVPVIAEGMYAYAGAGPRSAKEFDGTQKKLFTKPWMLITDDESKKIVIEEDDEELEEDIIDPTDAPTESTDATETTATAPSVAPDAPDATGATTATDATEATTPDDGYYDYGITPNLMITEGIPEYVPDGLYEAGFDTADMIRDTLVEMIWAVDDYSDMFAFFDITLMFFDGEEWVEASEEHYPEEGYITAMLPYPEGTDMDTPFTAVHMFGSDAFGMTAGDVELLAPVNTEDGILVELIGLSPVAIAWEGTGEYEDNYVTGDTSIGLYVGLMVVALLGMATTVVYSNKKRKTY